MTDFIFLIELSPIKPDIGLILWTTLVFLAVWFTLGRLAFRPIQNALKKREKDIQESLDQAKLAREEMANLKAENEELLAQAREERAMILKEAKEAKETIISDSKKQATEEFKKIVANAKYEIENQRMAAVTDLKNQVGVMAIQIAEKVLREKLKGNQDQEAFVNKLVDEIKLN